MVYQYHNKWNLIAGRESRAKGTRQQGRETTKSKAHVGKATMGKGDSLGGKALRRKDAVKVPLGKSATKHHKFRRRTQREHPQTYQLEGEDAKSKTDRDNDPIRKISPSAHPNHHNLVAITYINLHMRKGQG